MSEEERAKRFAERHFPEVSRFLASERGEQPASEPAETALPVFGPSVVFDDEGVTPAVIVRVAVALSRGQLLAVLGEAFAEIAPDADPETLTVEETRREVEGFLAAHASLAVDRAVEGVTGRTFPPEQQRVMQLLGEAVDRAYTVAAPAPKPLQRPRPLGGGRLALQTLDRGEVVVLEPEWCLGHEGEPVVHEADLTHNGRPVAVEFEGEQLLSALISWAPFGVEMPEPAPVVFVDGLPALDDEQLRELAAKVALHAGELYGLANRLQRLRRRP